MNLLNYNIFELVSTYPGRTLIIALAAIALAIALTFIGCGFAFNRSSNQEKKALTDLLKELEGFKSCYKSYDNVDHELYSEALTIQVETTLRWIANLSVKFKMEVAQVSKLFDFSKISLAIALANAVELKRYSYEYKSSIRPRILRGRINAFLFEANTDYDELNLFAAREGLVSSFTSDDLDKDVIAAVCIWELDRVEFRNKTEQDIPNAMEQINGILSSLRGIQAARAPVECYYHDITTIAAQTAFESLLRKLRDIGGLEPKKALAA